MNHPLVSTDWLADNQDRVRVVDGSWHMPSDGRDAAAEFFAARIPGAVHFDLEAISDHDSPLPHMLPSPEAFAAAVGALGVASTDSIVVYDSRGLFSAARVWWMFRVMGHDDVAVLDGGLPRWVAEGRPVESGPPPEPRARPFAADFRPGLVRDADAVLRVAESREALIVDARAADRFRGEAPEPRAGLRSGHIPGSSNVPWPSLLDEGALLPPDKLATRFADAGVDIDRPLVTSCGSGVSAATLALALAVLGRWDVPVYDGSWTEWGGDESFPVATGA
jgi:thiosulfate/3-mercaptopyruvate sulfurtransferase